MPDAAPKRLPIGSRNAFLDFEPVFSPKTDSKSKPKSSRKSWADASGTPTASPWARDSTPTWPRLGKLDLSSTFDLGFVFELAFLSVSVWFFARSRYLCLSLHLRFSIFLLIDLSDSLSLSLSVLLDGAWSMTLFLDGVFGVVCLHVRVNVILGACTDRLNTLWFSDEVARGDVVMNLDHQYQCNPI